MMLPIGRLYRAMGLRRKLMLTITGPMFMFAVAFQLLETQSEVREAYRDGIKRSEGIIKILSEDFERIKLTADQQDSADVVSQLRHITQFEHLFVYDSEGSVLFAYHRPDRPPIHPPDSSGPKREDQADSLLIRLRFDDQTRQTGVENVAVFISLDEIQEDQDRVLVHSLIIGSGILLMGLMLAYFLDRILSRPIVQLARTAERITESGDYSLRVEKMTEDEIGSLADAFNTMMAKIQSSSSALLEARDGLEIEVATRTSELEHSLDRLRESEDKVQSIVETASDGIITIDEHGIIQSYNNAARQLFGYSKEECIGLNVSMLMPPPHAKQHDSFLARYLQTNERHIIGTYREVEGKRKDGSIFPMSLGVSEIRRGEKRLFTGIVRDLTERKELENKIHHMAYYDQVTGLPNRRMMLDRLEMCLARARRQSEYKFAIFFLDLDRFKNVNDSFGHHMGDELLKQVAQRICRCVRDVDTVARLGGDEFTLIMDDVQGLKEVTRAANRILEDLALPFLIDGHEIFTGASIGIVPSDIQNPTTESLLRDADTAMYRAKSSGRGRYTIFDDEMHRFVAESLQLETDLKNALERGQFSLVYQPIIALGSNQLFGFEALLRWNHPKKGTVSPTTFIPIAEDIGAILQIGKWVLQEACEQLVQWRARFLELESLSINVNISLKQVLQPDFLNVVQEVLAKTLLPPHCLNLELTEGIFLREPKHIEEVFHSLKSIGVGIHLDDFGTGYSSLSYLKQFPIDFLKIDRSFISHIHVNFQNLEITRAILAIAKALNLEVVAEGIENQEQVSALIGTGCRYGQGYFISKPMEKGAAEEFLSSRVLEERQS